MSNFQAEAQKLVEKVLREHLVEGCRAKVDSPAELVRHIASILKKSDPTPEGR